MAGAAAGLGAVLAARSGLKRLREHRLRELRGQTVLITGGSRGLGLALAEEFAQFGAKVAICARDEQELARARQQLEDMGAVVCAVPCDVSKPEEVDNLINSVTCRRCWHAAQAGS
jgi:NAD(P)-dependent dehydrogenase (short-subunit alcohol dehydrogenase family)